MVFDSDQRPTEIAPDAPVLVEAIRLVDHPSDIQGFETVTLSAEELVDELDSTAATFHEHLYRAEALLLDIS